VGRRNKQRQTLELTPRNGAVKVAGCRQPGTKATTWVDFGNKCTKTMPSRGGPAQRTGFGYTGRFVSTSSSSAATAPRGTSSGYRDRWSGCRPGPHLLHRVDTQGGALTYNGARWKGPVTIDAGGNLASVSCAAPTSCAAVNLNDDQISVYAASTVVYRDGK
jgi:hypothetical protein